MPQPEAEEPPQVHTPSAIMVYALMQVSHFLITGGMFYYVTVEPPSVGSMTDERGHQRPIALSAHRGNGQDIMEGLTSSFLFIIGGSGFMIPDQSNAPNIPKLDRFLLLLLLGVVRVLLSFFMTTVFMRMKLQATGWVRVPFEKKSVGTGFVPVTEVLNAVPVL